MLVLRHTLGARVLLALFHQQTGGLGVGGWICWVKRAHYHTNEGGSATWKVTLEQSGHRRIRLQTHRLNLYVASLTYSFLPETGPVCLCPVLKGWGERWGVSGTSPPHRSPGTTAHHRPASETPGPSHTANLYLHCCMALLHRSTCKHMEQFISKFKCQNTLSINYLFSSPYLQYFVFLIKSPAEQTDDFSPWHMSMLMITAHLISLGTS